MDKPRFNFRIYKIYEKGYEKVFETTSQEEADSVDISDCARLLIIREDREHNRDDIYKFAINKERHAILKEEIQRRRNGK